jgi:cysteine desulfurase / selenocysteine lyase
VTTAAKIPTAHAGVNSPSARAAFDVEKIRRDFPILARDVRGKKLVYLDNAATSQKPRVVIDAITRYYEQENANIHRGVHFLSELATSEHDRARQAVKSFINAGDTREIVFVRGTTEAINLVAQTYGRVHVGSGDEVLITAMEHHSNIVPWQILCDEKDAKLRVAPINSCSMNSRSYLLLAQKS